MPINFSDDHSVNIFSKLDLLHNCTCMFYVRYFISNIFKSSHFILFFFAFGSLKDDSRLHPSVFPCPAIFVMPVSADAIKMLHLESMVPFGLNRNML